MFHLLIIVSILWLVFLPNTLWFYIDEATLTQFDYSTADKILCYILAASLAIKKP
ncbi:hypothetical protein DM860_009950 [Cuscuta australis]|uniref:Uncharacterized protein n=1 Tax=Cuscuta australis TaxID=267555 RepID=A0A328DF74_9ASTE|nr:hypothetical protein DM860_009950 [Cuscuta australis]